MLSEGDRERERSMMKGREWEIMKGRNKRAKRKGERERETDRQTQREEY